MKAVTLLQSDPKVNMETWPYSNWTGPNLPLQKSVENRILAQASSVLHQTPSWTAPASSISCSALQPSSLTSTSSSSPLLTSSTSSSSLLSSTSSPLLSSTSASSPLLSTNFSSSTLFSSSFLSTENTQLKRDPLLLSSSLFPLHATSPLLHSAAPPTANFPLACGAGVARPDQLTVDQKKRKFEPVSPSSSEPTVAFTEEISEDPDHEEMVEMDTALSPEPPVLNLKLGDEEEEQTLDLGDAFAEVTSGCDGKAELLKDKKYALLTMVCCSLVNKTSSPDQNDWDDKDSFWTQMRSLGKEITLSDPEFLLKVAVYTRQELNIRIMANFLLALAAHLPQSKAHLRRYFSAAVQLPSDWLEVTRIYSVCFSSSLPACLKKSLVDKFKQFSEYQLAKYNTRKHRGKHNQKKRKAEELSPEKWEQWANLVRADVYTLKALMHKSEGSAVDKKQSEFNMKKMIKRLHIKEPAEFVMGILGKRYPSDLRKFVRSGLSGVWQSERAGQRMKLKQPETWETTLGLEGNNAAAWEKLIDNNSVPFMAMLRNLRNMITQGISDSHHERILKRLTSTNAVINSRQLPFRFLSAYKVILELGNFVSGPVKQVSSSKEILLGILKRIPRCRRYQRKDWSVAGRKRLRAALGVPLIYSIYNMKRKLKQKASEKKYSPELLQRYRQALEKAVQISCRYNVPPLPGRTIIIFNDCFMSGDNWKGSKDIYIPPEFTDDPDNASLSSTTKEAALLLAVMISSCCEHPVFVLSDSGGMDEVKLKSDVFLENVRDLMKQTADFSNSSEKTPHSTFFSKLIAEKTKVDNIIMLDELYVEYQKGKAVEKYVKEATCDPLQITILIKADGSYVADPANPRNVCLYGFSEQILRFISEQGSSRLLDHVERIDKLRNIPPPVGGAAKPETAADIVPLPVAPKLRWREVRVFISSTFRDMHAERDVLVLGVFPELRRRAAPHCLYLQEVELRWGVTEEESRQATQLCLSEVCRSQLLLGILGERYGLVPPQPELPDLPQYNWLKAAPDGLSITEMEIRQFQALYPDSAQSRMMFYFRSPHLISSVPVEWRGDFASESSESAAKMNELKTWIRKSQFKVTENYPCEWGGVVDGRPCVKNLEDFAKATVEDLWATLQKLFVEEEEDVADLESELNEQEVHQDAQQRHFYGRRKLVSTAIEKVQECQKRGGILVVEGNHGEGKTAFMAGLAHALRSPDKYRKAAVCDVISYSTAASQSAAGVEHLLRCLVQWLRRRKEQEEELPPNTPYRELLSEFLWRVVEQRKSAALAVLVDDADIVQDSRGQPVSEWIPERLPKGVCLVLSVFKNSALRHTIAKRRGAVVLPLGSLSLPDRKEIVQKELSVYGKKLSDSAFNNQLQTLLMKKGAVSPYYLHLACDELRSYASFETMKKTLQTLPQNVSEMVQHVLLRLQAQFGAAGLDWTLAALTVSSTGLKERELYALLNLCRDLTSTPSSLTWDQALKLARKPRSRVPMATFSQLAQSLQGLICPSFSHEPDKPLALINPDVRSAFEQLYLSTEEERTRAHLILAAHLWVRSDPHGKDTFLHCDADTLVHLPAHLMECDQWQPLCFLLSSYYFLFANVRHGFLHSLLETYIQFEKRTEADEQHWNETSGVLDEFQACHSFLKRHAPVLSRWSSLFVQQAWNEPGDSSAHAWAQRVVEEGRVNPVRKLNDAHNAQQESGELVSTFQSEPSCVALSPGGGCVAVGTEEGTLHFIHTNTNQEVMSLVSNCDGISGCVFLGESVLSTTSYDGQVEMWDINSGCRTAHLNAHSNAITGCDVSSDKKYFATVSLDSNLKVWSQKGRQVGGLLSPCPLNCVVFDGEGGLLAVGCWDGTVRVWDWIKQDGWTTLSGHHSSIRSLSFSPSSSVLCSGALEGEVLLWSVPGLACVGRYQAHFGSAEALNFLPGGDTLLTAGHDGMVQLWSGGLGRSVSVLGEEKKLFKTSSSRHAEVSEDAALCVAVASGYAAVGYHGNGIKLFNLESGERVWSTASLRVSVLSVLWVGVEGSELLLSGAFDSRLRVWSRAGSHLTLRGTFGVQKGGILALAQSSTYVASASDDFTIALWLKSEVMLDPWVQPSAVSVLRGHTGGVTCLAFSPEGDHLLSGGKDKALMVWKVNASPPALSRSLPHCHGDWITGCAWSPNALLSCSTDCRLRFWDVQTGHSVREVSAASSLSTLSYWGDYVMLGCGDGLLMVWKSDVGVIAEIQAHQSRLHCSTIITKPDGEKRVEDLMMATASEDGTVKLWLPLQVEHRSTLLGHSGAVQALVSGRGTQFLTVSEDRSLRAWNVQTVNPPLRVQTVSALCFVEKFLVSGYSSGRLEIWYHTALLYSKQLSESRIQAVCGLPDDQLAVSCSDCSVTVFKLERGIDHRSVELSEVSSYTLEKGVNSLCYCTALLAVCMDATIVDIFSTVKEERRQLETWQHSLRILALYKNEDNGVWVLGEEENEMRLSFLLCIDPELELSSSQAKIQRENDNDDDAEEQQEEKDEEKKNFSITAAAMHNEFIVCGDSKGNIWYNQVPDTVSWSPRRPAHGDRISVLCVTDSTIISASYDRTIKLWDRNTKKQVGLFVCAAAVEVMEVDPQDPSQLVCGDALGQLYFLSWRG